MRRAIGILGIGALAACGAARAVPPVPADKPAASAVVASPAPTATPAPGVQEAVTLETAAPEPSAPPPPPAPTPMLTSQGYFTWIWPKPNADGRFLGVVRIGESVALKSTERVKGQHCSPGFYAIEPRGYVCADHTVSTAPDAHLQSIMSVLQADPGPFPYRYGLSNGSPMYSRVPTPKQQKRYEVFLGPPGKFKHLIKTLSAHEDLAIDAPITVDSERPSLFEGKSPAFPERQDALYDTIPLGSMLAFTKVFEAEGRKWLLSTDLTLVPADRVRQFRPSAFHGTELGKGVELPIAWMRKTDKPKYHKSESTMERTSALWPLRTFAPLTGSHVEVEGKSYWETREKDADGKAFFVADEDATVVEKRDHFPTAVTASDTWIFVSITNGTLVAYDGSTPVYATLISPGAGGVPVKGRDNVKASTTPLGSYRITYKDKATTMSPEQGKGRSLWIADVPHTQYFNPPFALHAAYWHERFGEPTSAGCVNLSPIDAKWLFDWSNPKVPIGWQGAAGAGAPENGPTTFVVIAR